MKIQNFSFNTNIQNLVLNELKNHIGIELLIIDRYSIKTQISGNFEQKVKGTKQKFRFFINKNILRVSQF